MNPESHWAAKRPIPFTNVSGEKIPAFAVMAITGVEDENGIAFLECDKPSATFRREYAVNNIFDVPAGLHGTCFRAGDLRALYDGGTPAAGEGWGPKPGQWTLSRGFAGFTTHGIAGSIHQIAKASFEPITQVLVKTTGQIGADATTQAYRVYAGAFGSETDAGFTTVPAARNRTGQSMDADEWAWLDWTGDGWELRCQQNRVYHATYLGAAVGPGATGGAILPDGRAAVFTNWSSDTTIETGDKILVWQDFADSLWYAVKSGGGSGGEDPENVRLFRAVVDEATGFDGDGTITCDNFEAFDNEPGEPGATNVDNPLELWGENNDWCLVAESPGLAGNNYTLLNTQQVRQPRWFVGHLNATLGQGNTVSVVIDTPLDGGENPGTVTCDNTQIRWAGPNGANCLVVENRSVDPIEYILAVVQHYACGT